MEPVLSVRDLKKTFASDEQECRVLEGISFDAFPGEILCIMGLRVREVHVAPHDRRS